MVRPRAAGRIMTLLGVLGLFRPHGSCPDSGWSEYGIWISGPVGGYQYQPGKCQVGMCHVEARPELRFFRLRILDLRIVPPPPADGGAPKDLRSFYHPLESLEGNQPNAHALGLSKESSGIRQKEEVRPERRTLGNLFYSHLLKEVLLDLRKVGVRTLPSL